MTFDTSPATPPPPHTNPDGAEEEERGMNSVTKMIYISISQHNILISSSRLMDGRGRISRPVSTVHNNILHSYCIMDRTQPCHSCLCVTFFKDILRVYHFPQQTGDVFVTSRSCGAPGRGKQQLILIVHDHLLPKGDLLKGVWLGGDLDKFISGRG